MIIANMKEDEINIKVVTLNSSDNYPQWGAPTAITPMTNGILSCDRNDLPILPISAAGQLKFDKAFSTETVQAALPA